MGAQVLRISAHGLPQSWISVQVAASDLVAGRVLYAFGEPVAQLRGGFNKHGNRSTLDVPAIITTRASNKTLVTRPAFTRGGLFARDGFMCMYCGVEQSSRHLTIDHIKPRSRGGRNDWKNTCAACVDCNQRKGNKTPEEAQMMLLGVPYEPNIYEHLFLQGRKLVTDQMQFLQAGFRNLKIA